jgi:solute:Na+ symporter, SSS family
VIPIAPSKRALGALLLFSALLLGAPSSVAQVFSWSELPPLPDPIGFAGPFVGVSGDSLIVAGGANFPDGRPWDGAPKIWHDRIFVLDDPGGVWRVADERLPRPLAYGVSVTWRDAVICVGGGNATEHLAECFAIRKGEAGLAIEDLPSLPFSAAFASGALLGDVLYVTGGIDRPGATECLGSFLALDLAVPPLRRAWSILESWPGPGRFLSISGAQDRSLFLFGGVQLTADENGTPSRVRPYLSDGYRFTPRPGELEGEWTPIAALPRPVAAAPSPAVALGDSHLVVFSGDDGSNLGADLRDQHPGFTDFVLVYHSITDTWIGGGAWPRKLDPAVSTWPPVTTTTTWWRDRLIVPSGEIRPGVRTPRILAATPIAPEPSFGAINYAVLVVYLAALVAMGFYFSKREKTTGDFFLGGQRVPWWAAGISIFGTQLSAITFLALPAKTYATDWLYFIQNLGIIAIAPIVVWMYLPFFRRLNLTTAYEYLELRFNLAIHLFGACSFIVFQLARMGVVMLLPALALTAVTGMDITTCIVVMGVLSTLYTVLGGIEAVIWTDVLQVAVLFGGAVIAVGIAISGIDGGFGAVLETANAHEKLRLAHFSWDWTGPALVVILLGSVFNNLVPYTSDQAVVQRYLTTRDEKRAAGAIWVGALLSFPASVLFFGVGTVLFAFYRQFPERLDALAPTDQIFAWFIVNELPVGISGLLIAGVFAAAMSSLDSSMNSIAAVVTTDLHRRFSPDRDDAHYLRVARWTTVVLGVVGTGAAIAMSQFGFRSLWDQFLGYIGLLGGTMAGLFALGIFCRRANSSGALVGAVAGIAALVYVKTMTHVSVLAYAAVGMVTCFVVGYLASLLFPDGRKDLRGLTLSTMGPNRLG